MNILLVEDDPNSIAFVKHCLKKNSVAHRLFVLRSGKDAVDFLKQSLNSSLDLVPSFVVVDLESTAVNGLYVLQVLGKEPKLDGTQIAAILTQQEPRDEGVFKALNISHFIKRPLDEAGLQPVVDSLLRLGAAQGQEPQIADQELELAEGTVSGLVISDDADERKRIVQALTRSSARSVSLDSTTWKGAKKQLRERPYSVVVASLDDKDPQAIERSMKTCRESTAGNGSLETGIIAVVAQEGDEVGRIAVEQGATLFIKRDSGAYLAVMAQLVYNMSERIRLQAVAERAIDAEKQTLREVIETAPLYMVRIDSRFRIRDCNESFSKVSKRLRHKLIGSQIFDVLPDLDVLAMVALFEKGESFRQDAFQVKAVGSFHTATTFWDIHAWRVTRSLASTYDAILIAADSSKRVALEQQREQFIAALAHDIRNPLVGTQRTIDTILSGKLGEMNPRIRQLLASLSRSNQALMLMLTNLIDIYQIETSGINMNFKPVDIRRLLLEEIDDMTHLLENMEIELVTTLPENLPKVSADPTSMRRLFMNLLYNALKYSQKKSRIEVGATVFYDSVYFKIENPGRPIDSQKLSSMFKKVIDGVPITRGSGLGLYLCKKIVNAHNGSLTCDCQKEDGIRFTFNLKVADLEHYP